MDDNEFEEFWPDDIRPSIQSPLEILRQRAHSLTSRTKQILVGSVTTTQSEDGEWDLHALNVNVPSLNNLEYRLFEVKHKKNMVYPAYVIADVFKAGGSAEQMLSEAVRRLTTREKPKNEALSDIELIKLLTMIVRDNPIKSTLISLIAQANEASRVS